jgi:type IV fimbrial biogenesis protein FimT
VSIVIAWSTRMKASTSQRGVTLVEAAVVIAILAILASSAAPSLRDLVDRRRLEGAASQLAADLQFARTEAVARHQPVRISFHGERCYVVHTGAAAQCSCAGDGPATCSGDARQVRTVRLADGDRAVLQANVGSIVFDPVLGTATPTGTLRVLGGQERAIHHVVNVLGRVRSCSPLGTMPGYRAC